MEGELADWTLWPQARVLASIGLLSHCWQWIEKDGELSYPTLKST